VEGLEIRLLNKEDPPRIAQACQNAGWKKSEAQYHRYLQAQGAGTRVCWIASMHGQFAGYVTLNWRPTYPGFAERNIAEIQDLNVLPEFRRKGIGTRLMDAAEKQAARNSAVVGIGVGLHPGYNQAQRMYVLRGYVPDGRGITYKYRYVEEGAQVPLDDDLILHFTKRLHTG
jgi:GNAT superfamily N-acetyltransferase